MCTFFTSVKRGHDHCFVYVCILLKWVIISRRPYFDDSGHKCAVIGPVVFEIVMFSMPYFCLLARIVLIFFHCLKIHDLRLQKASESGDLIPKVSAQCSCFAPSCSILINLALYPTADV